MTTERNAQGVMDTCANAIPNDLWRTRLREARAAVAELVEAVAFVAGFEPLPQNRDDDPCVITIPTSELRRIRAALARVQGGAA